MSLFIRSRPGLFTKSLSPFRNVLIKQKPSYNHIPIRCNSKIPPNDEFKHFWKFNNKDARFAIFGFAGMVTGFVGVPAIYLHHSYKTNDESCGIEVACVTFISSIGTGLILGISGAYIHLLLPFVSIAGSVEGFNYYMKHNRNKSVDTNPVNISEQKKKNKQIKYD